MKRVAHKLAIRAANRDIRIGVATGVALTGYRMLTVAAFVRDWPTPFGVLAAVLLFECVCYALFTFAVYRRSEAAAAALAGMYALRIAFISLFSGRSFPPISFLTLLLAYGLYRGIRGTSELAAMPVHPSTPLVSER
jgi:hypothetical protein